MSEETAGWLMFLAGIVVIVFGLRILGIILGQQEAPDAIVVRPPRARRKVQRRVVKVEPFVMTVPIEDLHPFDRQAFEEARRALDS